MNNKIALTKISQVKYELTSKQWNRFIKVIDLINMIENLFNNMDELKIKPSIFLNSLLEKEGVDSSRIEGTMTHYDEIFFDIEGINNVYSWETRNLINLYKDTFVKIRNKSFRLNIERLRVMHEQLYTAKSSKRIKNYFDSSLIIKKIKPGVIISDDSKPNWIGTKVKGIKQAQLVPIAPSKKEAWLNDLFDFVSKNTDRRELIILFHPIFEAIHPFSDGNGRIGRVLLTSLFKYFGLTKNNWFFFSDIIDQNKSEYLNMLHHVQTTGDWETWTDYFIGLLNDVAKKRFGQILEISRLFLRIVLSNRNLINFKDNRDSYVFKSFIKFPVLNKSLTVKHMVEKHGIPQASAYRMFDNVANIIEAKKITKNVFEFSKLLEIIKS